MDQKSFFLKTWKAECLMSSIEALLLQSSIDSIFQKKYRKWIGLGEGRMVSVVAFNSDDPSSNPAGVNSFYSVNVWQERKNRKSGRELPIFLNKTQKETDWNTGDEPQRHLSWQLPQLLLSQSKLKDSLKRVLKGERTDQNSRPLWPSKAVKAEYIGQRLWLVASRVVASNTRGLRCESICLL